MARTYLPANHGIAIALLLVLPLASAAGVWSTSRGDVSNQASMDGGVPQDPAIVWEFQTGEDIYTTPAIGEVVVVARWDGMAYGLDRLTGQAKWQTQFDDWIQASPALDADRVYILTRTGTVHALSLLDGSAVWERHIGGDSLAAIQIQDGALFVASGANVTKIRAVDGEALWRVDEGYDLIRGPPALANGLVIVAGLNGHMRALRDSDGVELWRVETGPIRGSPVAVGDLILVPKRQGALAAYSTGDQTLQWESGGFWQLESSPAVAGSTAVVVDYRNIIRAVSVETGETRWQMPSGGAAGSSPVISGGRIYSADPDGDLWAFGLDSGRLAWRLPLGGHFQSSPAIVVGVMYIGNRDGTMYAIQIELPGTAAETTPLAAVVVVGFATMALAWVARRRCGP
jgi:outer membrane protein assembly factor BamB